MPEPPVPGAGEGDAPPVPEPPSVAGAPDANMALEFATEVAGEGASEMFVRVLQDGA